MPGSTWNGFNVIIYDLRGHGMNSKTITTFTILEREDLYAMILDSRRRYPDMKVLGLHGESLGAGTTVAVLEKSRRLTSRWWTAGSMTWFLCLKWQ